MRTRIGSKMAKKLRVGILFGGRSGEHEVSLQSAASILKAIDRRKFDVAPIGIDKAGRWLIAEAAERLLEGQSLPANPGAQTLNSTAAGGADSVGVDPAGADSAIDSDRALGGQRLDVVFPVLHGTFGEDGTIQGLFDLAGMAYVGSGVLGSAAGMDKDLMKRLFAQAKLPIVKHMALLRADWEKSDRKSTRLN